jgi:hypothetical protein
MVPAIIANMALAREALTEGLRGDPGNGGIF